MPTSTHTLAPGSELAGFQIEDVAGRGGMGVVYRARQGELRRVVALKVIAAELSRDEELRARFAEEAQLAAAIDHPNIVPVYTAGEADGVLYLAMRFVDGTDLRALIEREGALAPGRAVAIVEQVGRALDAAHARGLIHRDVKPGNVLLDGDHAYLTDFGLSKLVAGGGHTRTGISVGTPDFMAPEQIRGEAVDARADVYALGCLLHHALTGTVPFPRDSDMATVYAHLECDPPRPSALAAVPPALDDVVARALAKEPAHRFRSCGELTEAARAAIDGAPPALASAPAGAAPTAAGAARSAASGPGGWPRGRRVALLVALPTLLVGGIGVAIGASSGGGGDDAAPPAKAAVAPAGAKAPAKKAAAATPVGAPTITATIPVGKGPDGVAVADGRVFVANREEGTLSRINRITNAETPGRIKLGVEPDAIAAGKGVVWVADGAGRKLQRLQGVPDPIPTATVPVGAGSQAVALGKQLVWVANTQDDTVNRVDRASPSVVGGPIGVGHKPAGIFVKSSVWVSNFADGTVTRIDPSTAQVVGAPIKVGRHPRGIIEGLGGVWVVNSADGTVTRLSPRTGKVVARAIRVGRNPREVTVGHGLVWVTNFDDNTVVRIDPKTNRVAGEPIAVGRAPLGIASGPDSIWVANHRDDTVTRIRPA